MLPGVGHTFSTWKGLLQRVGPGVPIDLDAEHEVIIEQVVRIRCIAAGDARDHLFFVPAQRRVRFLN